MTWLEIYFTDTENGLKTIIEKLDKKNEDFEIIVNNPNSIEIFKKNNFNTLLLDGIIPDIHNDSKELFKDAKNQINKHEKRLSKLQYNEINFFNNIEYFLLVKNFFFIKIDKILSKKKNRVFVFDIFEQMFLPIIKIGEKNEYEIKKIIEIKNGKEIKINISKKLIEQKSQIKQKYKKIENKKEITTWIQVGKKTFPLIKKIIEVKTKKRLGKNIFEQVKKDIDKKMENSKNIKYGFFISAVRKDLYFDQWEIIYNKLNKNKSNCSFFTNDFSTLEIFKDTKINNISFAEETNVLTNYIRNSEEGSKLKNEISRIFHEENSILELMQNEILDIIFRTIATEIILRWVFSKLNLQSVILCSDSTIFERVITKISKEQKIKTFAMVPTNILFNPVFSEWFTADKIFCYGPNDLELLKKMGYDENRILISGNPKYDKYFERENLKLLKNKFFHKNNLDKNRKVVLIMMSEWHKDDTNWIIELVNFLYDNSCQTIIKIHPKFKKIMIELTKKNIKEINYKCKGKCSVIIDEDSTFLISLSDVFITDYSSAIFGALFLKKPSFNINFNFNERLKKNISIPFADEKISTFVESIDKLKIEIIQKLNNKKIDDNIEQGFKKYFKYDDGCATDRIIKKLELN
jgi:CDP-glycerol glycerophosphotransferase (TagB/SpsB family)